MEQMVLLTLLPTGDDRTEWFGVVCFGANGVWQDRTNGSVYFGDDQRGQDKRYGDICFGNTGGGQGDIVRYCMVG